MPCDTVLTNEKRGAGYRAHTVSAKFHQPKTERAPSSFPLFCFGSFFSLAQHQGRYACTLPLSGRKYENGARQDRPRGRKAQMTSSWFELLPWRATCLGPYSLGPRAPRFLCLAAGCLPHEDGVLYLGHAVAMPWLVEDRAMQGRPGRAASSTGLPLSSDFYLCLLTSP